MGSSFKPGVQSISIAFEHLRIACGGCVALVCGKQLHGLPWIGSVEPPL